ncbi:YopX family protein [Bacillus cereus]
MREIKFRGMPIEDYGDTKWFYGNAIVNYEDKLAYIEASGQGFVPVKWETVSQFTDLKDEKGNEIYEGDILKGPTLYETPENHSTTYSYWDVTYKNASFYLGDSAIEEDIDWILEECEVVGNVYENKELLKGADKE